MTDLYTWDYVALRTGRRPTVAPHLAAAGLWFEVTLPPAEDDSPGHPRRMPPTWRPWHDGEHAWIDMTTDGRPWWRGAYMRAWGGQFDPGLGVYECAGEAPPERDSGRGEQWSLARGVCRIGVDLRVVRELQSRRLRRDAHV